MSLRMLQKKVPFEIPRVLLLMNGSKDLEESQPAQPNGRLVQNPLNPPLKPKPVYNQAKVIEHFGSLCFIRKG